MGLQFLFHPSSTPSSAQMRPHSQRAAHARKGTHSVPVTLQPSSPVSSLPAPPLQILMVWPMAAVHNGCAAGDRDSADSQLAHCTPSSRTSCPSKPTRKRQKKRRKREQKRALHLPWAGRGAAYIVIFREQFSSRELRKTTDVR